MSKREIPENNKENDVYNLKSDVEGRISQIYDIKNTREKIIHTHC